MLSVTVEELLPLLNMLYTDNLYVFFFLLPDGLLKLHGVYVTKIHTLPLLPKVKIQIAPNYPQY